MKGFTHLIIVLLVAASLPVTAQALQFGDSVEVSLLTCEPGEAVYARFGHTALRIKDHQGRDMAYNYGIFDFRTENFYWKFLRGETDYLLGVYPTEYFLEEYKERESVVWEQVLNLTATEKKQLIDLLNINYLPQNRMYRYNFVFDNCATRPKVILEEALQGVLSYESGYSSETYRELIHHYVRNDAWLSLGINIVFGAQADQPVNQGGASFLPELLRNDLQKAQISPDGSESGNRKLVSEIRMIAGPYAKLVTTTPWWLHPLFFTLLWLVAGILLSLLPHKRRWQSKSFDTILYSITALAGSIIFLLSFFSVHPLVGDNWNLLWLNPLNFIPAVLIWIRSARKFLLFYHIVNLVLLLTAALVISLEVQLVPLAILPVLLLLILRTTRRLRRLIRRHVDTSNRKWKWRS